MQKIIKDKKRLTVIFLFSCAFMLAYSISGNIYGILLPRIREFYNISLADVSILNVVNDISAAAVMMFMLLVADRINKRLLLTFGAILFGIALFAFGSAPSFAILLVARVFIGTVGGLVNNILSAYISDVYGEDRSRYLAVLHTLFAIGSFIGPTFSTLMVNLGGWNLAYIFMGIFFFSAGSMFLILSKMMKISKLDVKRGKAGVREKIPYIEMLKNKNVQWLCLGNISMAMVFFATLWAPTYLDSVDSSVYNMEMITIMMTTYSVGMIISRMSYTYVSTRIKPAVYLRFALLISAVILASMIVISNVYLWIGGMFFYGLVSGATYTAGIVLACKEYPKFSATITSLTGLFTMLANMLFNTVIGNLMEAGQQTVAMLIPAVVLASGFFIYTFGYKEKVNTVEN